jgi:hypothetical protein
MRKLLFAGAAASFAVGALALPLRAAPESTDPNLDLEAPVRVLDGEKPIDVDIGHAAPAIHDFDGDGKWDLLVGQFKDGKARIYHNKGTNSAPKFEGFEWLKAGGVDAKVPYG